MTQGPLVTGYDLVIFDLDGVLYLVDEVIAGAAEAVAELRRTGVAVAYATNNASRSAKAVADLLTSLGIEADPADVVTAGGATAATLAERFGAGATVLVVGAPALRAEVVAAGLKPVDSAADRPDVVVQGYGPAVGWADLAEACVAVRAGSAWFATNADRTLPSPRGPLPGNGSLVAALRTALDREPDAIVGKPDPGLFVEAARARNATRPLVVGDRLDTDVEGGRRAGMNTLLVLTGVSQPSDVLTAIPAQRPDFIAADLAGLFDSSAVVAVPGTGATTWQVRAEGDRRILAGNGAPLDALAELCREQWAAPAPAGEITPSGEAAAAVLRQYGLAR